MAIAPVCNMFAAFQRNHLTTTKPPHHANDTATSFRNPWSQSKGFLTSGQVFNNIALPPLEWAKVLHGHPAEPCRLCLPDFGKQVQELGVIKATWLGHAGFMVEMCKVDKEIDPVRILFDPIWSDRASPTQMVGPQRRLCPPCALEDLPDFHFVVTSHNHYDHLDWPTIEKIYSLKGPQVQFLVPLGNKQWFCNGGIPFEQVTEMDWWDGIELSRRANGMPPNSGEVRFICTPAQHGSGRGLHDQRATLWASWVVQQTVSGKTISVYHGGDTGYMTEKGPCPVFKEIGDKYGPFDLAMLPIWRGGSLSFIAAMGLRLANTELTDGLHASPAHALRLHKDIQSRHSLGMHFATFAGSNIEAFEPIVELYAAKEEQQVGDWTEEGGFGTIDVGATAVLPVTHQDVAARVTFEKLCQDC